MGEADILILCVASQNCKIGLLCVFLVSSEPTHFGQYSHLDPSTCT